MILHPLCLLDLCKETLSPGVMMLEQFSPSPPRAQPGTRKDLKILMSFGSVAPLSAQSSSSGRGSCHFAELQEMKLGF